MEKNEQKDNVFEADDKIYKTIVENTSDLIALLSFSLRPKYMYVSPSHEKILGYKLKDLIGADGMKYIHPQDKEKIVGLLKKYLVNKTKNLIQEKDKKITENLLRYRVIDKYGKWHYLESTADLAGGKILIISNDVTERIVNEKLIRTQRDLGLALSIENSIKSVAQLCLGFCLRVSNLDSGGIYIKDKDENILYLIYHEGLTEKFIDQVSVFQENSGFADFISQRKSFFSNYNLVPFLKKIKSDEKLEAVAIVPIVYERQVIGCMNLASHDLREVPSFSRLALESIVSQMGGAIMRIQTQEELEDNIKKLKEANSIMVGRELKMIELKKKIEKLEKELEQYKK